MIDGASVTPTASDPTVTVRLVRGILAAVRAAGHDATALATACGVDPAVLFDEDARLPYERVAALWQRAENVVGSTLCLQALASFAMHQVGGLPFGSPYTVVQLFTASATVGDGLQRYARYFALATDAWRFDVVPGDDGLAMRIASSVQLAPPPGLLAMQTGMLMQMLNASAVAPLGSLCVALALPPPSKPAAHHALFGRAVKFGASSFEVALDAADLAVPLRAADATLVTALEQRADLLLESFQPDRALVSRVRRTVADMLSDGATLSRVAAGLGTSARTLSRRLEAAGTSHRIVVDEVRRERARRHLIDERLSIDEVAWRLGFSKAPAFFRAFKRWFGASPDEYRRKQAHGAERIGRTP